MEDDRPLPAQDTVRAGSLGGAGHGHGNKAGQIKMRRQETQGRASGAEAAGRKPQPAGQPPIAAPWGGDIHTGEEAQNAVREHEEYVQTLTSMHRSCRQTVDWQERVHAPAPVEPLHLNTHEIIAQQKLAQYQPSLLSRLMGQAGNERRALQEAVSAGWVRDEHLFAEASAQYQRDLLLHEEAIEAARRVAANDHAAMLQTVALFEPLAPIGPLGQRPAFLELAPRTWAVELTMNGTDVVPRDRARRLASGRIAIQEFPQHEYERLYRDYVCSASLRAARELLALLPLDELIVSAVDERVHPHTGEVVSRTMLTFRAPRQKMEYLNFYALDGPEAMQQFWHRADFGCTGTMTAMDPEFEETD
jgi:hypothetical protein